MKFIRSNGKVTWGDGEPMYVFGPSKHTFRDGAPGVIDEDGTTYWCAPGRTAPGFPARKDEDEFCRTILFPDERNKRSLNERVMHLTNSTRWDDV
jgi:hypothetical protein